MNIMQQLPDHSQDVPGSRDKSPNPSPGRQDALDIPNSPSMKRKSLFALIITSFVF
jgi:hypothetical protein